MQPMMKKKITSKAPMILGCLLLALASTAGVAEDRWLHVRVEEKNGSGEKVRVNIPLQIVQAILPAIETHQLRDGILDLDLDLGHGHLDGLDLRKILEALQDAPDADFVTVESVGESVRVSKDKGFLLVTADTDDERVRVRMPLGVVEALLGDGKGTELDLVAGLARLSEFDGGDLVTVQSDDTSVRVWIDADQGSN